jgi:hypothetical protein
VLAPPRTRPGPAHAGMGTSPARACGRGARMASKSSGMRSASLSVGSSTRLRRGLPTDAAPVSAVAAGGGARPLSGTREGFCTGAGFTGATTLATAGAGARSGTTSGRRLGAAGARVGGGGGGGGRRRAVNCS